MYELAYCEVVKEGDNNNDVGGYAKDAFKCKLKILIILLILLSMPLGNICSMLALISIVNGQTSKPSIQS